MARTRSIKPGFFHDTRLTALPAHARLLFTGMWCYADREGRLEEDVRQLKHDILPEDRCDIGRLLDSLASGDKPSIIRYEVNGRKYIQIRTWKKHQNPHQKEPASIIPAPESPRQAPDESCTGTVNSDASPASSLVLVPITLNPEPLTRNPEPGPERASSPEANGNPPPPPARQKSTEPIEAVRLAFVAATGKPVEPGDRLPSDLASRAANLGAHPGALCRWIAHQTARAASRGKPPESIAFFAAIIDAELPVYLARRETEPLTGVPFEPGWARVESIACPACGGAMTRFADGVVVGCLCRRGSKQRGLERAKFAVPAGPKADTSAPPKRALEAGS